MKKISSSSDNTITIFKLFNIHIKCYTNINRPFKTS